MICAVTCFFNPCGYENPLRNYRRFRSALSGVELFTIELSFGRRYIPEATMTVEGGKQNLMWQKERLLNLLVESLPDKYDKIAWIDADVIFANGDWHHEASSRLDDVPVVQLFENVRYTDGRLQVQTTLPGIVAAVRQGRPLPPIHGAPGFAWAARREILPLYDGHVIGSGDLLMVFAWYGIWRGITRQRLSRQSQSHLFDWAGPAYRRVQGRLDCVTGTITHLYHGSREHRNYTGRVRYLAGHRFDPRTDIALDHNGLWRWSSDKPEMHRLVARYFAERREDQGGMTNDETPNDERMTKPE